MEKKPGRSKKTQAQQQWEKALRVRLVEIRRKEFPDLNETKGRQEMADLLGISRDAYEKWEQRGAVSGFGIALICGKVHVSPFELLGVPSATEQLSTDANRIALQFDRLSPEYKDLMLRNALSYQRAMAPAAAKRARRAVANVKE